LLYFYSRQLREDFVPAYVHLEDAETQILQKIDSPTIIVMTSFAWNTRPKLNWCIVAIKFDIWWQQFQ